MATITEQKLNRKKAPHIKDAVEYNLQLRPYQLHTLSNGVKVYAINAGAEDVLMLECVFKAGNFFENQNLVAATANFMLKNGTSTKNAFQINEHFEYHGAYLNRASQNERATLTLHCLSKHVGALLPVMAELLQDSVFPEEELAIYKQNMRQRLNVNLKKCDFVATRLIDAYVYGEQHPYGRYTRFEDFEALNRQQIVDFYKQYYQQGDWCIFAAGKLPDDLILQLEATLGKLPYKPVQIPQLGVTPINEKKHRVINDPNGVQGAVRMAAPLPGGRHHPQFMQLQVLNNLFGGFFGSRLMSNIREDKGYTYGIYSYLENHPHESAWVVSTEAGRDVCEATVAEVYNEMQTLREKEVDKEELSLVQNYMMGLILGDLDGPFQIINRWKNIILNDLPEDYFNQQIETIKSISPAQMQSLAQEHLVPEKFYELVVV